MSKQLPPAKQPLGRGPLDVPPALAPSPSTFLVFQMPRASFSPDFSLLHG